MKKAALFFDIDGTLLSEKTRRVPDSAKEALKQARGTFGGAEKRTSFIYQYRENYVLDSGTVKAVHV